MAVVSVNETWNGRRAEASRDDQTQVVIVYTKIFTVVTNDTLDGSLVILKNPLVPQLGDLYTEPNAVVGDGFPIGNTTLARCLHVYPEQDSEDPNVWRVRAEYSNEPYTTPFDVPPEIEWGTENYTYPALVDLDDFPILNYAGDPFNPPFMGLEQAAHLRITRNEPISPAPLIFTYVTTLNDNAFQGRPPGQAMMTAINGVLINPPNKLISYWKVTYEIQFRKRGWQPNLKEEGYRVKRTILGVPYIANAIDTTGHLYSTPVALNVDGTQRAANLDPLFKTFTYYDSVDWTPLALPDATV